MKENNQRITRSLARLRTFHKSHTYFIKVTHISQKLRIFQKSYAYFTKVTHISKKVANILYMSIWEVSPNNQPPHPAKISKVRNRSTFS